MVSIDFEDLASGTFVSTQYKADGVTFIETPLAPLPVVHWEPGKAKVLQIRSNVEVAYCFAKGEFDKPRRTVVLSVLNVKDSPATVELHGLDAAGNVVASTKPSLGPGETATLMIERPLDDIYAFIVRTPTTHDRIVITKLAFNETEAASVPDFGLLASHQDPFGLSCRPGSSVDVKVQIVRVNGSTGDVQLSVEGLPAGTTAVFLPVARDEHTLRISVAKDAAAASLVRVKISGQPSSPAVGPTSRSTEVIFSITGHFAIKSVWADLPPCTTMSIPMEVSIAQTGLGSAVTWSGSVELNVASLEPLPPGVQVKFVPPVVQLSAMTPSVAVMMEVRDESHLTTGAISFAVIGSSPPYSPAVASVELRRIPASLTGFAPRSGDGPRRLQPGTEITLTGTGFCTGGVGTSVEFGNDKAVVKAHWIAPDGKSARARIPRLGTTGPLKVTSPVGTMTSAFPLRVYTYRNTHGFSFDNPPITGGVNYGELTEAFGKEQTWITVSFDPCAGIPIVGWFLNCKIEVSLFPNPLGLIVLGLAHTLDACCFGMSLTSVRLMRGDRALTSFPPTGAQKTWDLANPSAPSAGLHHHVFITSLQQFGAEFMRNWLSNFADAVALTSRVAESMAAKSKLSMLLSKGEHPLISLRNGGQGHLVVACDIEDATEPNVAYYIYIYDPNVPFLAKENTESATHEANEIAMSRITVYGDGTWHYPGLGGWGPFGFHTLSETLGICPYSTTPIRPTFPVSVDGLLTLVFGAAITAQLESADDRRLLTDDGDLNPDPNTRPAAAPYAGLSGPHSRATGLVIGEEERAITWTLQATDDGTYGAVILGSRLSMRLDGLPVTAKSRERIGHDEDLQAFTFATTDPSKPLAVTLVARAGDQTFRTISLETTTFGEGGESLRYDAEHDSVVYRHDGPSTRCTIVLGWTGTTALPSAFISRDLEVSPGLEIVLRPSNWQNLELEPVVISARTPDGDCSVTEQHTQPPHVRPTVTLRAALEGSGFKVDIEAQLPQSEQWISLILTWAITHGSSVEQSGTEVISEGLSEAAVTRSFQFTPSRPGMHELVVYARGVTAGLPTLVCGAEARMQLKGGPGKPLIKGKPNNK